MQAGPSVQAPPASSLPLALSPWRRWFRRLLAVALVMAGLYVFRGPLLRQMGSFLVVNELGGGDALLVFDGQGTVYDEAGRLYGAGSVARVLIYQLRPRRSQQVGAVAFGEITSRRELARRGVPEGIITVVPAEGRRAWDKAIALRDWLHENPEANVLLLCERFESRWIRAVVNRTLAGSDAGRVHLQAVADSRYDETNWWRRKEGTLDLFNSYVRLGYVCLNGDGGAVQPDLSADEYEQAIGGSP